MFVNWEGRPREFPAVFVNPNALPDARILAGIAEELGAPLGFRSTQRRPCPDGRDGPVGRRPRRAARAAAPVLGHGPKKSTLALATWKLMLDNGTMQDGEKYLRATAAYRRSAACPAALPRLGRW